MLTTPLLMSSEESGEDIIDDQVHQVLYVKPLSWRKPSVKNFLRLMDEKAKASVGARSDIGK